MAMPAASKASPFALASAAQDAARAERRAECGRRAPAAGELEALVGHRARVVVAAELLEAERD